MCGVKLFGQPFFIIVDDCGDTFFENFTFSSVNFSSFGWKLLIPARTWQESEENNYFQISNDVMHLLK